MKRNIGRVAAACGIVVAAVLVLGAGTASAVPRTANGCIYCDANGNRLLDAIDTPLAGVTVNVQRGGTYPDSFFAASGADGCFSIGLTWPDSSWSESLDASTLPADAAFIDPNTNSHLFTIIEETHPVDTRDWLIASATCRVPTCGDGVLDEGEQCDDGNNAAGDGCSSTCTLESGGGCTPGYWKQAQHFDSWVFYTPQTMFSAVFDNAFPGRTLLQVLNLGGGGLNALGRHAVAAVLDAQNAEVNYGLSVPEVIAIFNGAFPGTTTTYEDAKAILQSNNELGCPLD